MQLDRIGIDESVSTVFPPERLRDELSGSPVDVDVVDGETVTLSDVDAVITFDYRPAFLDEVSWVHCILAGVDQFPVEEFEDRGVVLTNSTGIHDTSVGETVAGYMLSFARRLHRHRDHQRDREWVQPEWDEAFTLDGETCCVVGTGTLGTGVVRHANGLGMDVVGVRRSPSPVDGVETVYGPDELHEAVSEARFVVVTVPLNEETVGMVDASTFAAMREDAYLVNVARGPVVDELALVSALEDGDVAGAALDVFETEPLPEDSPLWELDEVIVSPHCAAFTVDYFRDVAALVRENVVRTRGEASMKNRVA